MSIFLGLIMSAFIIFIGIGIIAIIMDIKSDMSSDKIQVTLSLLKTIGRVFFLAALGIFYISLEYLSENIYLSTALLITTVIFFIIHHILFHKQMKLSSRL